MMQQKKTYLFLHGAMRGAWLWHKVKPLVESSGSDVIAYDLPGHGQRTEERAGVTMSTYIDDVVAYIRRNDLHNLILVGHSMSGIIISRTAEIVPDRIGGLAYLAAVVPRDGDALIDLLTPERQEALHKLEGKANELFGPIEALRPNYFTDQTGEEQDYYLRQLTPQPFAAFFEKIRLTTFSRLKIPRSYILGLRDKALPPELTRSFAARLGVQPVEIDAGHDMMVVKPYDVAEALLKVG
jgi:pimeloyl-ACP methyl ester carboxylesterase